MSIHTEDARAAVQRSDELQFGPDPSPRALRDAVRALIQAVEELEEARSVALGVAADLMREASMAASERDQEMLRSLARRLRAE